MLPLYFKSDSKKNIQPMKYQKVVTKWFSIELVASIHDQHIALLLQCLNISEILELDIKNQETFNKSIILVNTTSHIFIFKKYYMFIFRQSVFLKYSKNEIIQCARHVSRITFIDHAYNQKIRKKQNLRGTIYYMEITL